MIEKGLFITVEGPDGAGKSTQIEFIKKYFDEKGLDVLYTREPGGTVISEKIRNIILDKEHTEMAPMTEAMLYAAARAQLVHQVIKPAIEAGKIVICDRFVDSSVAYQGHGRGLGESVWDINQHAVDGCMPELTLLLMVDSEKGIGRVKNLGSENMDRLEKEKIDFHKMVYEGYLALARKFPERIATIDASQTIEKVSEDIGKELDRCLENRM